MRPANIISGCAIALWLGLFLVGRSLLLGIPSQKAAGYPSAAQIDYFVIFPASVAIILLIAVALGNAFHRGSRALIIGSAISSLLAVAYFLSLGGGV